MHQRDEEVLRQRAAEQAGTGNGGPAFCMRLTPHDCTAMPKAIHIGQAAQSPCPKLLWAYSLMATLRRVQMQLSNCLSCNAFRRLSNGEHLVQAFLIAFKALMVSLVLFIFGKGISNPADSSCMHWVAHVPQPAHLLTCLTCMSCVRAGTGAGQEASDADAEEPTSPESPQREQSAGQDRHPCCDHNLS